MITFQFNAGRSRQAIGGAMLLLKDMTPLFADIAEHLERTTKQRFLQGVTPDGKPWAPKSKATLERYKKLGYGNLPKPLIGRTKTLSQDIQSVVTSSSVTIGSSLIYSGVMQDGAAKGAFGKTSRGGPIPWGRIPARTWLGLSKEDDAAIIDIVDEHLEERLDSGN